MVPARTAGLPGNRAMVIVCPPLFTSDPRLGFVFCKLVDAMKASVASELKLLA
jgi:hypothetical protein